MQEKSQHKDR